MQQLGREFFASFLLFIGGGDIRATIRLITDWKKAHIWAHLQQRAGLLISSCGDMIKTRIKTLASHPVTQSVNTAACPPACLLASSAPVLRLAFTALGKQDSADAQGQAVVAYIYNAERHKTHYASSSINRLQPTFCPSGYTHILKWSDKCSYGSVVKLT